MVNEPIDGSNKLRLLVQIKCWMTNGLPDRHTSYKNRYRCGLRGGIVYSNAAVLKKAMHFLYAWPSMSGWCLYD